jgi:hypothetical protein
MSSNTEFCIQQNWVNEDLDQLKTTISKGVCACVCGIVFFYICIHSISLHEMFNAEDSQLTLSLRLLDCAYFIIYDSKIFFHGDKLISYGLGK